MAKVEVYKYITGIINKVVLCNISKVVLAWVKSICTKEWISYYTGILQTRFKSEKLE